MCIETVEKRMAESAEILPDKSGLYYGSPRPIMEDIGVSSGPAYHELKERGIVSIRSGKNGLWHIPQNIMQRYVS
mgnify:FL=1